MADQLLAQVMTRVQAEGMKWLYKALQPAGSADHSTLNYFFPDAGMVQGLCGTPELSGSVGVWL